MESSPNSQSKRNDENISPLYKKKDRRDENPDPSSTEPGTEAEKADTDGEIRKEKVNATKRISSNFNETLSALDTSMNSAGEGVY